MSLNNSFYTRLDHPWSAEILGPNGIPYPTVAYADMRDRSRRLERESALAYGILDRSVENVIGSGMTVQPKTDDPEFNAEIVDLWTEWTSGKQADVRRLYSFSQLQRLAYRAKLRDGDCGFILVDRTKRGFRWPELQFVEGDLIQNPTGSAAGRTLFEGIEYNGYNAPVAYNVRNADRSTTRIEARDFVYIHNTVRYNVGRGEPRFHGTYRIFDQLEGHIEAVVIAARIAASQAMIAKRKNPQGKIAGMAQTQRADGTMARSKIIEPGQINYIDTDEDLVGFNPTQPHQDFKGFIVTVARMLGLKFGLTVERVLLDFSQANYSVSRSTALQEIRAAEPEQQEFDASFFARVYPWFVSKMVNLGYVKRKAPQNMWAYDWIPQGRPLVEPSAEASGLQALIKMGVEAPENVAASMGYNWQKLLATLAKNKAELEAVGLSLTGESLQNAPASSN